MINTGTVTIETERLILRPFRAVDAPAAFKNWTNDDKVTEFLRWPTHKSLITTEHVLDDWLGKYADKNFYQWAIVPKDGNDEPVGTISAVDMDEKINMVHIGYCIGSRWWNRGITSEAFAAIIPFFFDVVKVNRIESQHDPYNPNSGKVMLKCGLKYEGTLRQADHNNKGIVDASVYAILASDYYAAKRNYTTENYS